MEFPVIPPDYSPETHRKIQNVFYKIGKLNDPKAQVVLMPDGKWYRTAHNTKVMLYDYRIKSWAFKNDNIHYKYGLVGKDELGFFSDPNDLSIPLDNGEEAMNVEIALAAGFKDCYSRGVFSKTPVKGQPIRVDNTMYPYSLSAVNSVSFDFPEPYNKLDKINPILKVLNNTTFGMEFETSMGIIPKYAIKKTGLVPLRDGSISGIEYVTVPLKGITGISFLKEATTQLSNRCIVNDSCSLHLNIHKEIYDYRFVVAMYEIFYRIQSDIYQYIIPYKNNPVFLYKKSGKDHNRPLPKIVANSTLEYYYKIVRLFTGQKVDNTDQISQNTSAKWTQEGRYYIVNFLKYICEDSNNLIEFRVHHPTLDFTESMWWLAICSATMKYAESIVNEGSIEALVKSKEKLTLVDVVTNIYNKDTNFCIALNDYIMGQTLKHVNILNSSNSSREIFNLTTNMLNRQANVKSYFE